MKPLTVVSGHSRSGTSMMMRILHDGGMNIVADQESLEGKPGNIHGTFEIKDYGWLIRNHLKIAGSAVKIVTQYIHVLEALILETPLPVQVLFMQRSLDAIQRSLKERNQVWDPPPHESIALGYKVLRYHKVPTLYVKYEEALKYPAATCLNMQEFLNRPDLDLEKMIAAIDPAENHQGG